MLDIVRERNAPIRLHFFLSLPPGGRIDRDKSLFKGERNHQTAGSKVALNEQVVPCFCIVPKPFPQWSQVTVDLRHIRRNLPPELLEVVGQTDKPLNRKRRAGVRTLPGRQLVVENQE